MSGKMYGVFPIVGYMTFPDGSGGFRHEPLCGQDIAEFWYNTIAAKTKREFDKSDNKTTLSVDGSKGT